MIVLDRAFYEQDTVEVAGLLIGCLLLRRIEGETVIVRITETEAYTGAEDPASHAYRGVTPRNRPMFGEAGTLYVYLSYGIHHCINIVTERSGTPGAVLLRGAVPVAGADRIRLNRPGVADRSLLNGPGKLAKGLDVTLGMNGYRMLQENSEFVIAQKETPLPFRRTGRIGITKAVELPWRFIAEEGVF